MGGAESNGREIQMQGKDWPWPQGHEGKANVCVGWSAGFEWQGGKMTKSEGDGTVKMVEEDL